MILDPNGPIVCHQEAMLSSSSLRGSFHRRTCCSSAMLQSLWRHSGTRLIGQQAHLQHCDGIPWCAQPRRRSCGCHPDAADSSSTAVEGDGQGRGRPGGIAGASQSRRGCGCTESALLPEEHCHGRSWSDRSSLPQWPQRPVGHHLANCGFREPHRPWSPSPRTTATLTDPNSAGDAGCCDELSCCCHHRCCQRSRRGSRCRLMVVRALHLLMPSADGLALVPKTIAPGRTFPRGRHSSTAPHSCCDDDLSSAGRQQQELSQNSPSSGIQINQHGRYEELGHCSPGKQTEDIMFCSERPCP